MRDEEFVMSKNSSNDVRFSGEYMVQDSDHLGAIPQTTDKATRVTVRQPEQSQSGGRQQNGGKARGDRQRQTH